MVPRIPKPEPGPGDKWGAELNTILDELDDRTTPEALSATIGAEVDRLWYLDAYNAFLKGWSFQTGQGTSATTTTATASAGASTLPVASGTSFVNGTVLVLGAGTTEQQVNKVASGGGTTTLTLVNPLDFAVASGAAVTPLWGDDGHMNTLAGGAAWRAFAHFIMEARKPDGTRIISRPGKIVFLGNSWMTASNQANYESQVHEVYPTATVVMAGVSGNNSAQILARFDTDCPADADFVVIPEPGVNASASESRLAQMQNMLALAAKVRAIGAVPIFTGPVSVSTALNSTAQQDIDQRGLVGPVPFAALAQTAPSGSVSYGSQNVFKRDTSGSLSALGQAAGGSNTSGTANTAVGQFSLATNATSSGSTAVGASTLTNATAGPNTAVGYQVCQSVTTGVRNTGVGNAALALQATTNDATAVGDRALAKNTVSGNTAVGSQAGAEVTTGGSNVFVGIRAGESPNFVAANRSTTASAQTFVGSYTGQNSTTQRDNVTAVGNAALVGAAGATALGQASQAVHTDSVALGKGAITTAANQVMVGDRDVESTRTGGGIILRSPDGTRYKITVANGGTLTVAPA